MNIGDSIIRARYRDSLAHARLVEPGQISTININLNPTLILFKQGHRIRVDISSSNFPRCDVNPNTGDPLRQSRRLIPADITVYFDADHASHIALPVVSLSGP